MSDTRKANPARESRDRELLMRRLAECGFHVIGEIRNASPPKARLAFGGIGKGPLEPISEV